MVIGYILSAKLCPSKYEAGKEDPVWHTARAPRNFEVGHPRIMVLA